MKRYTKIKLLNTTNGFMLPISINAMHTLIMQWNAYNNAMRIGMSMIIISLVGIHATLEKTAEKLYKEVK